MPQLDDNTLDELRKLNGLRDKAKDLRKRGLAALDALASEAIKDPEKIKNFDLSTTDWRSGPHPIDMALLVGVLNHRNIGDHNSNAPPALQNILRDEITIEALFPESTRDEQSDPVPVLTAARVLNTLMNRSETVFSRASMLCYYRVVRELYTPRSPDWIIGAARGGPGGRASAFVTAECLRAILAFEKSITDTITFFTSTKRLLEEFERIERIPNKVHSSLKVPAEHLHSGKQIQFERLALEWYTTNNQRRNVIALDFKKLFFPDKESELPGKNPRDFIKDMLGRLPDLLQENTKKASEEIRKAKTEIEGFRAEEAGVLNIDEIEKLVSLTTENEYKDNKKSLSKSFVDLIDQTCTTLAEIAEDRRSNQITEAEENTRKEKKVRETRDRVEEIFRRQVIINPKAHDALKVRLRSTLSDDKNNGRDLTLMWKLETNEGLINLLYAMNGDDAANEISISGDVLVNLNRLLLEHYLRRLIPNDYQRFNRTISAHDKALKVVLDAVRQAEAAHENLKDASYERLSENLQGIIEQYEEIKKRIQRLIDPAKQYIQTVLHRELAHASNPAKFDVGELLFAATSFGATNQWGPDELLDEARRLLINLLPNDGRMRTNRAVHSTSRGLKLVPISFELTRSLAHLLQKDKDTDLDHRVVSRMLNLFENPISIPKQDQIGWTLVSAPEQNKPNVWVTSVAVFALDRIVRMLNERINRAIFNHFREEHPKELGLDTLVYPDHELQSHFEPSNNSDYSETPARFDGVSVSIRLQQMLAHISRAVLPSHYSPKSSEKKHQRIYSAIFYGPPGTGKTTLAEALACTAKAPLVRLSPGDLMVHGTDVVESRARVIFECLSMLTRTVIVLDEFEPVVRRRDIERDSDPAEFRFLVTGMLPKLRTLNKAAKEQSLVYCLATNLLGDVDAAAKRAERFDLHIPIYHPDPISRYQEFLYRMICLVKKGWEKDIQKRMEEEDFWLRLRETISRTRNVSAQSLATDFFKGPSKDSKEQGDLTSYVKDALPDSFFQYVLDKEMESARCPEPSKELIEQPAKKQERYKPTPVELDIKKQLEQLEEYWVSNSSTKTKSR